MENTSEREVIIFLNMQRDTILLNSDVTEESIRLTKTFAQELYKQGIKSIIYTNGYSMDKDEMLVLEEFDSTKNYMDIVNCSLAALKVKEGGNVHKEYEEESFTEIYSEKIRKIPTNKYMVFISNYQREDFQNMLTDLKKSGRDFSWIIPVSNRKDIHINNYLNKDAHIWRLNWGRCRKITMNVQLETKKGFGNIVDICSSIMFLQIVYSALLAVCYVRLSEWKNRFSAAALFIYSNFTNNSIHIGKVHNRNVETVTCGNYKCFNAYFCSTNTK